MVCGVEIFERREVVFTHIVMRKIVPADQSPAKKSHSKILHNPSISMADWMDESVDEGSLTEEDHYALGRAPEPSSDASSDIRSFLVSPVPSHSQPGANPAAAGASSSASSSSQANDSQQSWSLPSQSQSQSSSSSARAREPPRVIVSSTFAEGGAPSAWPPPVTAPLRDWAWGSEHLRLPCAVENTVRGPFFFCFVF
jgi:hypothetical protein